MNGTSDNKILIFTRQKNKLSQNSNAATLKMFRAAIQDNYSKAQRR